MDRRQCYLFGWCLPLMQLDSQVLKSLQQQHERLNLKHDNLEPFRIIYATNSGVSIPAIVTSWHQNSEILTYVSQNPKVDKEPLLRQLASAVCYLHALGVTHGNIYTVGHICSAV